MVQAPYQGLLLLSTQGMGSWEHQTDPGSCKSPPCPSLAEVTPRISLSVARSSEQPEVPSCWKMQNLWLLPQHRFPPSLWADLSPQAAAPAAGSCSFITLFLSGAAAKDKPERRPPLGLSGSPSIWSCSSWRPFKRAARQLPSTCEEGRQPLSSRDALMKPLALGSSLPAGTASWSL